MKWKVNGWYEVEWNGKTLTGGDTFSADPDEIAAQVLSQYVSVVIEEKAAEPSENKAESSAPNKAKPASKTRKK